MPDKAPYATYQGTQSTGPGGLNINLNAERKRELVSIIIVSYDDLKHLKKLFPSIYSQSYNNIEVIVVDNANNKEVQEFVKNQPKTKLIVSDKNLGYSGGNNLGAKHASGEFIFILNPDTWLEKDTIRKLVRRIKEKEKIGVIVPKVMLGDTNIINSVGKKLVELHWGGSAVNIGGNEEDKGQHDKAKRVFSHDGAAFLVKKEVIDHIGLFDDAYFMRTETSDFSHRVNMAGHEIVTCPSAVVHHYKEGSWKGAQQILRGLQLRLATRNELITMLKDYELQTVLKFLPLRIVYTCGSAIKYFLRRKDIYAGTQILMGLWEFFSLLPYCLRKRKEIVRIRKISDREIFSIGR